MTSEPIFDQLATTLDSAGCTALLAELAGYLRQQERYHELFEARKMQLRQALSLSLTRGESDDDLPDDVRDRLEAGLIDACREVGLLLIRSGRLRDAWHYLRAVGDRALVRQELSALEPSDNNLDEFLELCVHEGFDLQRGFQLMLSHYGTCNTITTFDSAMYGRPRRERAVGARLLVQHVHDELLRNVRSHIERLEGQLPAETSLDAMLANRPALFAQGAYHVDTTHLASVVRFARDLDDPPSLRLALALAHYGQRLDASLQYPGDEPFEDLYPRSISYFRALLQDDLAAQLADFRQRAETVDPRESTTIAIETYVDLLARVGRPREALEEALRLLPEGVPQTGRAPSLLELAEAAEDFTPLIRLTRQRGDIVGYAISLLRSHPATSAERNLSQVPQSG